MADSILFAVEDGIATITLNRPERRNAFDDPMIEAWHARLVECGKREDVKVVVVTGTGKAFCAGGDVGTFGQNEEAESPRLIKQRLWEVVEQIPRTLAQMDKPVIAAVNGSATGAGMDMALMCDMRFAAESASFAESYVRMALVPGAGGAWFLPRLVGQAKAMELFFSGDFVDADEAHRIGIVNQVWPDSELLDRTYDYARKVARAAPISVRLIKRAIRQAMGIDLVTHLDQISSHMILARSSEDHVEAVAAFREKRDPVFKGR